ncbi:Uu.00g133220.m01.CDS01 [Anthostomella pinea]|uniref:Uu.00g133220.m01.CDS01 n=1 Tax=Anthostomella pinea TaxID=933095 RepID=A0AAI8VU64_9PEZI|nr:Uu.00g133220.m01.CDS01 [Anthostomella pinea]
MSAHPHHGPVQGDNPNYYDEGPAELSAGDVNAPPPHPLQSHPVGVSSHHDQSQQQYFPPPPPGPPPTNQHNNQYPPPQELEQHPGGQEEQYYPPPPPGPPPIQIHPPSVSSHRHSTSPPPAYTIEADQGAEFVPDQKPPVQEPAQQYTSHQQHVPPPVQGAAQHHTQQHAQPPALPPRPSSSQGPQYPPPPTSPSHAAAGVAAATAAATAAAAGPSSEHHHQPGTGATADSSTGKQSFSHKFYQWGQKVGLPINKLTNKLGSEAFWPSSMDNECDKAARILKSFCKDGFYKTQSNHPPPSPGHPTSPGPSTESKVLVKIPKAAITNAKGLAIFTTFRAGLHISGAGGSGIVLARLPDGSWSPPSGFLVHTLGAGIMAGLDIYDCVCVLNTPSAVDAFTKPRLSLGGEIAVVAGPIGAGASVEAALAKGQMKPIWNYMKSRGLYAGMQADGTIIVQRPGANAAFYGEDKIDVQRILKGQVKPATHQGPKVGVGGTKDGIVMWPEGGRRLMEVLKDAEGKGADAGVLREVGDHPTPGDLAPAQPTNAGEGTQGLDPKGSFRYG